MAGTFFSWSLLPKKKGEGGKLFKLVYVAFKRREADRDGRRIRAKKTEEEEPGEGGGLVIMAQTFHTRKHTHPLSLTHAQTHPATHIHTHTHTHTHTCTHNICVEHFLQTHTHSHTHTQTHTQTPAHAHMHTHTHAHTRYMC